MASIALAIVLAVSMLAGASSPQARARANVRVNVSLAWTSVLNDVLARLFIDRAREVLTVRLKE